MDRHRNRSESSECIDTGLRAHRLQYGRWQAQIDSRDIVVSVSPFRVVAFENRCPHRGLPLDDAAIKGRTLTCPFHGRRFDLRDGRPLSSKDNPTAAGRPLPVFSVARKDGRLLVRLPRRVSPKPGH
ncbi:Rieske (2Fe-2S) protein [Nocardia sp.]|uniref:Rieske (2Fe-2S) protein n=1 Tax=Nocardia sp. TaxID=1821 RepID=UPI002618F8F1|nr:Rieske (2Fe-2S) protein [Nocardia sp.]